MIKKFGVIICFGVLVICCSGRLLKEEQAISTIKNVYKYNSGEYMDIKGISKSGKKLVLIKFQISEEEFTARLRKYNTGWEFVEIQDSSGDWIDPNEIKDHLGNVIPPYKQISTIELKNSMWIQITGTKWVVKSENKQLQKLVLVPSISFKIKNISQDLLRYVSLSAIFRFIDDAAALGDAFLVVFHPFPLYPSKQSKEFTLISNFGVEGRNLDHIKGNPNWKTVVCSIYAHPMGMEPFLVGEYEVSKTIYILEEKD